MALIRPKSLRELALEYIRGRIVDGHLEMGQPLSERKISEELGVSKSPVREALAQLREEGLVLIEPQKGAQVFTLSEEEVNQICDFRQLVEGAAFKLALARNAKKLAGDMDHIVEKMRKALKSGNVTKYLSLDTEFHTVIFKNCQNSYLEASYERFVGKIAALRTHLAKLPEHTSLSMSEHEEMAAAVRKEKLPELIKLLDAHIERTRETYVYSLTLLSQHND